MGRLRDWPFVAYVAFSVLVLGATGVSRVRFQRALARFADCSAHGDAECAAEGLATAEDVAPKDPRTKVAKADLHAILGEADQAERALAQAIGRTSDDDMERALRADVLLTRGDIAVLRGREEQARARWIEATPLVDDPALVDLRRDRVDAARFVASSALSDRLVGLRAAFDKLMEAARTGDVAATDAQRTALDAQIGNLPGDQRGRLLRASGAVRAAAMSVAANRRATDSHWTPDGTGTLEPPKEPSPEDAKRYPWMQQAYEARRQSYIRMQKAAEDQHFNALRAQTSDLQAASDNEARALAEAQRLVDEAFASAGGGGTKP